MKRGWKSVSASVALIAALSWAVGVQASGDPGSGGRLTLFVSDLHMGIGRVDETGAWHPEEDFRWDAEFERFLDFAGKSSDNRTDLIFLGDLLELWQSADVRCEANEGDRRCRVMDCSYSDSEIGCTEEEALVRMRRIIKDIPRHLLR